MSNQQTSQKRIRNYIYSIFGKDSPEYLEFERVVAERKVQHAKDRLETPDGIAEDSLTRASGVSAGLRGNAMGGKDRKSAPLRQLIKDFGRHGDYRVGGSHDVSVMQSTADALDAATARVAELEVQRDEALEGFARLHRIYLNDVDPDGGEYGGEHTPDWVRNLLRKCAPISQQT